MFGEVILNYIIIILAICTAICLNASLVNMFVQKRPECPFNNSAASKNCNKLLKS